MRKHAGLSYEPADHSPEWRQALAAWALFAVLLVTAVGASIGRASFPDGTHETSLARSGEADVVMLSAGFGKSTTTSVPVCADDRSS
jgi:cyanate permease